MSNVPKIVIERLKAKPSGGNHPDADMLTAFSEQALPERERDVVLEHLSRCGDCREMVALASPVSEMAETIPVPVRRGGLTWPALRWGFVAAGVVTIAAFGVLQFGRTLKPAMMSSTVSPRIEVATEARPDTLASTAAVPVKKRDEAKTIDGYVDADAAKSPGAMIAEDRATSVDVRKSKARPGQVSANVLAGAIHGTVSPGPAMPTQWQQNNATQNAGGWNNATQGNAPVSLPTPSMFAQQKASDFSTATAPSGASESAAVSGEAAQVETEAKNQAPQGGQRQPAAPQPLADEYDKVGKAKPSVSAEVGGAAPDQTAPGANMPQELPVQTRNYSANGRNLNELVALTPGAVPIWSINSAGVLQRSFDQGSSWQNVDVRAGSASAAGLLSLELARTSRAKEEKEEKDTDNKKTVQREVAIPVFRAVAALGQEVWAGGSGGALYHSQDAGSHWTQVVPSSSGASLSGDIVSLQFSDAEHGKVTTSVPEIWTTNDRGRSWQKQ